MERVARDTSLGFQDFSIHLEDVSSNYESNVPVARDIISRDMVGTKYARTIRHHINVQSWHSISEKLSTQLHTISCNLSKRFLYCISTQCLETLDDNFSTQD